MFGIKKKKIFPVISNEQERKKEYKRLTQELEMEEQIKERRKSTYKKRGRRKVRLRDEIRLFFQDEFMGLHVRWGEKTGIPTLELFEKMLEKNLLKSVVDCKTAYEKRKKGLEEMGQLLRKWRDQTKLPLAYLRGKRFLCTTKDLPEFDKKTQNMLIGYMDTFELLNSNAYGGGIKPSELLQDMEKVIWEHTTEEKRNDTTQDESKTA